MAPKIPNPFGLPDPFNITDSEKCSVCGKDVYFGVVKNKKLVHKRCLYLNNEPTVNTITISSFLFSSLL